MQLSGRLLLCVVCWTLLGSCNADEKVNPLGKVVELLTGLQTKVLSDGEREEAAYHKFFEWCDDETFEAQSEIKTAGKQQSKLDAAAGKATSDIADASTKIEELASKISEDQSNLKSSTLIRDKERSNFEDAEKELESAIDMLARAAGILEKEAGGGSASLLQASVDTSELEDVLTGVASVIDATGIAGAEDKQKLVAFLESRQEARESDDGLGAPDSEAYESHSSGIVEVIEDMKEKAEQQLSSARKAEANAQQNYSLLKQSLEDSSAQGSKEIEEEKAGKADAEEAKAVAVGSLEEVAEQLKAAQKAFASLQHECMQKASDHDITVKGRKEELKTIAEAKKTLQSSTSGAVAQTYSMLQVKSTSRKAAVMSSMRVGVKNAEVVQLLRKLAQRQHSPALAQLASRIQAVLRFGSSMNDPFGKVKNLIQEMLTKLLGEQAAEADEKAYCDEEMAKTDAKKSELEDETDGLKAKIDEAASAAAQLKEEVKDLQSQLAELHKSQATIDKVRQETHAAYLVAKEDLTEGLAGVRQAIKVLSDYYGGQTEETALVQDEESASFTAMMQQPAAPENFEKSAGAGGGIIEILKVVESDFAKNIAEEDAEEDSGSSLYEDTTQENKVTNAEKEKDVQYKTQKFKALDKTLSELSGDLDSASAELTAVLDYFGKVKERCVARPESYEERKRRREAELAGLKQALTILEGESVSFLSRHQS